LAAERWRLIYGSPKAPASVARGERLATESSFFRFFQLSYLGGVFGTGIGVNKLEDLAIVADR
jgi:hypothetical protein